MNMMWICEFPVKPKVFLPNSGLHNTTLALNTKVDMTLNKEAKNKYENYKFCSRLEYSNLLDNGMIYDKICRII